jgi:hypothetical protein
MVHLHVWTIFGTGRFYDDERWQAPVPRVGDRVTLGAQEGIVAEVHWHLNARGMPIAEVILQARPGINAHGMPIANDTEGR